MNENHRAILDTLIMGCFIVAVTTFLIIIGVIG